MNRIVPLIIVIALAACGNENALRDDLAAQPSGEPLPLDNQQVTDVIIQTLTPTVDILYMVDNSCSMGDDQDDLAQNFPVFMRWFLGSGLDYHIGVVSSDMIDPNQKGKLQGGSNQRWISSNDTNQVARFQQMAVLGSGGSFPERGTGGVYFSQEYQPAKTFNAGFFRDSSAIHTIAVSDEKDYSERQGDIGLGEFINWYDGLKRDAEERTFSAIENPNAVSYVSGGRAYAEVTRVIGGVVWDIREDDWSRALDILGLRATGRKTEYFLSRLPVDPTIEVIVRTPLGNGDYNEAIYPRGYWSKDGLVDEEGNPAVGEYWYYTEGRNSITFVEYVPDDQSKVAITYTPRSATFE